RNQANTAINKPNKPNSKPNNKGSRNSNRVSKKNSWKKEKGQFCKLCNRANHKSEDCFLLNPDKAPESIQKQFKQLGIDIQNKARKKREETTNALIVNKMLSETPLEELKNRVIEEIPKTPEEFVDVLDTHETEVINTLLLTTKSIYRPLTDLDITSLS